MPDGSKRLGTSWETSPMDIAKAIAKSLSERIVIAKVCIMMLMKIARCLNLGDYAGRWTTLGSRASIGEIGLFRAFRL